MRPLGEVFGEAYRRLTEKHVQTSKSDLEYLFVSKLKIDRLSLTTEKTRLIDETLVIEGIERLLEGEPLAYVLGDVPFLGCDIHVTPDVLIPRPETELLVAYILEKLKGRSGILVDLCTGSGCIGIALKKNLPSFEVILTDYSEKALKIAEENSVRNQVEVTLIHGDFLEALRGKKVDIVVSNPPYVTAEEYLLIDRSVRDYEPKMALVAPNDGLFFYQKLQKELPPLLNKEGELFLEIGSTQGESVSGLFTTPDWKDTEVMKDLAGHPRFVHTHLR